MCEYSKALIRHQLFKNTSGVKPEGHAHNLGWKELRDVDDKKDEFSVVFVLRFRWLDPNLKAGYCLRSGKALPAWYW